MSVKLASEAEVIEKIESIRKRTGIDPDVIGCCISNYNDSDCCSRFRNSGCGSFETCKILSTFYI